MKTVYLDSNATTPLHPEVAQLMHAELLAGYANPASSHRMGQQARQQLNHYRDQILSAVGADPRGPRSERLILTSGGTESNNLALFGFARRPGAPRRIVVSSIEHPSVSETATALQQMGFSVDRIACGPNGVISLEHLEELLGEPASVVSLMAVNNETGVVQPVAAAAEICQAADVPFHTDAVQAIGKIPCRFTDIGCAALTLTAHKLHGPRGIGGLVLRHDVELQPLLFGGFQQLGTRPGTEDVALAAGFARAVELALTNFTDRQKKIDRLRRQFESHLRSDLEGLIEIIGDQVPRACHTSNIAFLGIDRQAMLLALDMQGICCSTGSACASGSSELSPVLLAMNVPDAVVRSALRFSFHAFLGTDQIELASQKISATARRLSN